MENTDTALLGVIALASVATAISTGITAGKSIGGSGTGGGNPASVNPDTSGDDKDKKTPENS